MESSGHAFGALVRRRRRALDLTQAALADLVGCTESLIRKIEAEERRPSRQVAERLAGALAIEPHARGRFIRMARGEQAAAEPVAGPQAGRLPPTGSGLVGREAELRALESLLRDPDVRLVTIVAPGGMGKTRLALAAAARQQRSARFPDGVYFVDLTAVDDQTGMAAGLVALFQLPAGSGGREARSAEAQALGFLQRKRMLLVLDNAEQLRGAASFCAALLRDAPGVALLVTSRERLRLYGEQLFPLGGLAVPAAPELAAHADSTLLFLQSVRRARPEWAPAAADYPAIAAICGLTGGMPLAIELAAAWASVLAPAAIVAELRRSLDILAADLWDAPERQRSVRAVLDATWQQMGPRLRAVFARLAVFRGGFSRAAGEAVADATLADLAALVALAVLSFDTAHERYTLHELLRQYAAERLAEQGDAASHARDAHARFYCALVAEHGPGLRGAAQQAARSLLEHDQENIAAAWRRAIQHRQLDLLTRAVHALGLFYELRAETIRGAAAFDAEAAVLAEQLAGEPLLAARLLTWRSAFLRPLGELAEAERCARRALALLALAPGAQASGHEPDAVGAEAWLVAEAHAQIRLGLVIDELRGEEALSLYSAALERYRAAGKDWEASYVLYQLGGLCCDLGQLDAAIGHARASLALREACGDRRGVAHTLQLLSRIHAGAGELGAALDLARRCHSLFEQLGDRAGIAKGLRQIAAVLGQRGRPDEALPLAEQSLAIYRELGLAAELDATRALVDQLGAP